MANPSTHNDHTREQLIPLLQEASRLIGTQLDISHCASEGEPFLGEARCQSCHQLAACSWSYHRTPDAQLQALPLSDLQRDFSLALMLIDRYHSAFEFTPEEHTQAEHWLVLAQAFLATKPTAQH